MRGCVAVIALSLGIASCATVSETMAGREPDGIYQTAKSPQAYHACIVGNQQFAELQITPLGEGYMFVSTRVPGQVFTVESAASGSEVRVWGFLGTRRTARACL